MLPPMFQSIIHIHVCVRERERYVERERERERGGEGGRESNAFKRSVEEGKRERLFPFSSAFPDALARTFSFSFLVQFLFSVF